MCYKVSNSKIDVILATEELKAEFQEREYKLGAKLLAENLEPQKVPQQGLF